MSSYKRFDGFYWGITFFIVLLIFILSVKKNNAEGIIIYFIFLLISGFALFIKIRKWFKEPD